MTTETRQITLVDLPTLRRLSSQGVILDSEIRVLQEDYGAYSAFLSSKLFNRGTYTLVSRSASQEVVGQFRYRTEDVNAHLVYLAPLLENSQDAHGLGLHLLDGMAKEAGKLGAHALVAEVDAHSPLFELLRGARFACYMRQVIWRHDPVHARVLVPLTEECGNDQIGIMSLICHTISPLQQAVTAPPNDMQGFVYRHEGHVEAYIAMREGKQGVYLLPYIHPKLLPQASAIVETAVAYVAKSTKLPIYVNVRSYQAWLSDALSDMGFTPYAEQALMVRHIALGVRPNGFARVAVQGNLETANVAPPYWSVVQHDDEERPNRLVWKNESQMTSTF